MSQNNKVVAHFVGGKTLPGTTLDFVPNRPLFHVRPRDGGENVKIRCRDLKAIFFVKEFSGSPEREDLRGFLAAPAERNQGRKVAVRFADGEFLCGYTLGYSTEREGFMVFPADEGGNNLRIYVIRAATKLIKLGPAAETLADQVLQETAQS